jgi:hypothetical protein
LRGPVPICSGARRWSRIRWFARNRDGHFIAHGEEPGLFRTCMFTSYYTEHIAAIMREVNMRYDIDGIYTNG